MRFAFVSTMAGAPWGGSEELWSQAALHLVAQGHHVSASVVWWPVLSDRVIDLERRGIKLCVQPNPQGLIRRGIRKIKQKAGFQPIIGRWLQKQKPDLICVSNGGYGDNIEILEVCLKNKIPYVCVVQSNAECFWPRDDVAERLIKVYDGALRAFFVSNGNKELLETQLGIALGNAQVIRNPFNVKWDASTPWPDERAGWKVACVARLEPPAKGQDLLFQVLASGVWQNRPLMLSVFGKGPMEQGLKRLASRLNLNNRVYFAGHVSNVEEVWATHHALVLPSRYEGLPLALVEAMLCGRTAIVTDVAGNSELVMDNINGFIASSPSVAQLADAMERSWSRRNEWQEMGAAARVLARERIPKDPAALFAQILAKLTT